MSNRIVQLVQLSSPLWVVYAEESPNEAGECFIIDPVVCLALVEDLDEDSGKSENRFRDVQPVTLHGDYLDVDDADNKIALIDTLPTTTKDMDDLNTLALSYVRRKQRERMAMAAKTAGSK